MRDTPQDYFLLLYFLHSTSESLNLIYLMFDTVKSKDFIHACEKPSTLSITKKALSSIKVLLIKCI